MLRCTTTTREDEQSMKKELGFIYITTDGKVFVDEKTARKHEEKITTAAQK